MANWDYTLVSGTALHNAIREEDIELVVQCLIACYKELQRKLNDDDREWRGYDIEDAIFNLENFGPEEDIDYYLDEFYDLCDALRAWITL